MQQRAQSVNAGDTSAMWCRERSYYIPRHVQRKQLLLVDQCSEKKRGRRTIYLVPSEAQAEKIDLGDGGGAHF